MANSQRRKAQRFFALMNQNWRCFFCLEPLRWRDSTVEHLVPWHTCRQIGEPNPHRSENLAATCQDCNVGRDLLPAEDFISIITADDKPSDVRFVLAWAKRRRYLAEFNKEVS